MTFQDRFIHCIPHSLSILTTTPLMSTLIPTGCMNGECRSRALHTHVSPAKRYTSADSLREAVSVHRRYLCTRDQQVVVLHIRRLRQMSVAEVGPQLCSRLVVGHQPGEERIVARAGSILVDSQTADGHEQEVAPELVDESCAQCLGQCPGASDGDADAYALSGGYTVVSSW